MADRGAVNLNDSLLRRYHINSDSLKKQAVGRSRRCSRLHYCAIALVMYDMSQRTWLCDKALPRKNNVLFLFFLNNFSNYINTYYILH